MSLKKYILFLLWIGSAFPCLARNASTEDWTFQFSIHLTGKRAVEERVIYISRYRSPYLEGYTEIFREVLPDSTGRFSCTLPCKASETLTISGILFRCLLVAEPGEKIECSLSIPDSIPAGFQSKPLIRAHITSPESGMHAGLEGAENALQKFYTDHYALFIKPTLIRPKLAALDSVFKIIGKQFNYPGVHAYCRYAMARLYETSGVNKTSLERTYVAVPDKKRNVWWQEYVAFYYQNYFSRFQSGSGWKELEDAIQVLHSIEQVRSVVKRLDPRQNNDTLRDILIAKGLFDLRNQKNIQADAIQLLLNFLSTQGVGNESRQLAKACLQVMVRFEAGQAVALNSIAEKDLELLLQKARNHRLVWWCAFDPNGSEMDREWVLLNKLMMVYDRKIGVVLSPVLLKKGQRFVPSPLLDVGKEASVVPLISLRQAEELGISSLPFSSLVEMDSDGHLIWHTWACPLPGQGLESLLKSTFSKQGK